MRGPSTLTTRTCAVLVLLCIALAPDARAVPPDGPYQIDFSGAATLSPLPETFAVVESTPGTDYEYQFRPQVDARGRITGVVDVRVEGTVEGGIGFSVTLTAPLRGSIKGRTGDGRVPESRLKLGFKLAGLLDVGGAMRKFKLAGKFGATLNHSETSHDISGKRSFKIDGGESSKERSNFVLQTVASDANWSLSLEIDADGDELSGTAVLGFRGSALAELELHGKHSDNSQFSSLSGKTLEKGGALKIKSLELLPNGTATFELSYKLLGHKGRVSDAGGNVVFFRAESEGSPGAPIDVTGVVPYRGQTQPDVPSYYLITGLEPRAKYEFTLGDFSGQVARLSVYLDAALQNRACMSEARTGLKPCPAQLDDNGRAFLVVESGPFSAAYTLSVEFVEAGGFVDEGTRAAPVDVTGSLPRDGTVWRGRSYYGIDGLTPGAVYTATLSNFVLAPDPNAQKVDMALAGEVIAQASADCRNFTPDTPDPNSTLDCAARANATGSLLVDVGGAATVDGASFTLSLASGGIPNEGFDTPLDITGSLPWSGTVHHRGVSQYLIGGLTPGALHTVTLTPTQEVQLQVFEVDASLNRVQRLCRTDFDLSTTVEVCEVTPPTDHIVVWVFTYSSGTAPPGVTFSLDVTR